MHIHSRSPTTRAQHRTSQHVKGQDELVLARFGQPVLSLFVLHRDGLRTLPLILSLTYEFKWNLALSLKLNSRYHLVLVLLYDWLAYFLFFAKPELVNHILGNPYLLSCWPMIYGLMDESLLYLLMCLGNFYQKENLHSFTTPRVCPTKAIYWPSWYKSLHIWALLLHWASSNFVTLVRCLFILAWSRSCALHQLNFYTGS